MIDTENKRRSILNRVWAKVLPAPDGSIASAGDRGHLAFLYSGSAFGGEIPGSAAGDGLLWMLRRRRRRFEHERGWV